MMRPVDATGRRHYCQDENATVTSAAGSNGSRWHCNCVGGPYYVPSAGGRFTVASEMDVLTSFFGDPPARMCGKVQRITLQKPVTVLADQTINFETDEDLGMTICVVRDDTGAVVDSVFCDIEGPQS